MAKKKIITFIDSTNLHATLKKWARENGRSLGAEIRRILEAEIERREAADGK